MSKNDQKNSIKKCYPLGKAKAFMEDKTEEEIL